jgi:hypothetical protein
MDPINPKVEATENALLRPLDGPPNLPRMLGCSMTDFTPGLEAGGTVRGAMDSTAPRLPARASGRALDRARARRMPLIFHRRHRATA